MLAASAFHFLQRLIQIEGGAAVMAGGQERGSNQDMMLRSVHINKWIFHQLLHQSDGIFRRAVFTALKDYLDALLGVALVADIMAVFTAGIGGKDFMADLAFHLPGLLKIDQRLAADQACSFFSRHVAFSFFVPSGSESSGLA